MRPDVHLRPDRLRQHAAEAGELAETLRATAIRRPAVRELDDVDTTLRRAVRELTELSAILVATAADAEAADAEAAASVRHGDLP